MVAVISALAAASIGLSTLWLTWAALKEAGRSRGTVSGLTLGQVADQLAIAVGKQWTDEVAIRRLNEPYPLPVSWTAAEPSLTDAWDSLVELAASGAGWPSPPPAGTWAAGPDDLGGEGGDLAEVLTRVPTGRLVVLGGPGAGKTMLMVRLVLDLLARRAEGGPVPILASVASWNPEGQDLRDWLGTQLVIDYPALASPPPIGREEPTQAAALLASGLILPVLDGLDEIPEKVRGAAISQINDALRPGEQVVVTCRTRQYRDAVRPKGGVEVTLRAAAVQLRLLNPDAVRRYLCDNAAGPVTRARWDPVLAVLGTEAPAGQALRTPLMVGLARAIYNPRPGELAGALRDPAELCSPALADRTAAESLLFDAFIPAAYRHDPAGRWKAQDAERWLLFLACHLERTIDSADLNWWEIHSAAPRWLAGLSVGLIAGLAGASGLVNGAGVGIGLITAVTVVLVVRRWIQPPTGLARGLTGGLIGGVAGALAVHAVIGASLGPALEGGLADGLVIGYLGEFRAGLAGGFAGGFVGILVGHPYLGYGGRLINGLGLGLAAGCTAGLAQRRSSPARELRWSPIGFILALGVGLVLGFAVWLQAGPVGALMAGLAGTAGIGFVAGLEAAPADAAEAADPRAVAARDRATFWKTGLAAGLAVGLITCFAVGFTSDFTQGIEVGLAVAVAVALAVGFRQASWGQFTVAQWWLAIWGRLPRHLMGFLTDAHRRGVLRQAGAVYQFWHIELQHRLANRDANEQQASSSVVLTAAELRLLAGETHDEDD